MKTVKVVLNLGGLSATETQLFGNHVFTSMTGNPKFPVPFPALPVLGTALNNLSAAITAARPGNAALTADLYQKQRVVKKILRAMGAYVEYTGDDDEETVLSSGFSIKKSRPAGTRIFSVRNGSTAGAARLATRREASSAYAWQYTKDPIGSSPWTDAGISVQAHFTVRGLTPLVNYWFRAAVINKDGQQDWCNPCHLVVI